ncbi:hypothetical protein GCM10011514_49970 [Emticicia aquatilis]|uniref:Uncharacterized protein n=1 Tax=Emticicia aquatilis TaxID=1537369 RepID=A0A916Z8N3_9BACT|nr:hypothetical protein [Emticicia aquatilis]GGD79973.1 hypothetical protein GCM10011514_49970 [Emticicia aquatilis]
MYTSYIGKKFLKLYREKEKKPHDYSAKQFFDEVFFPLFFDDEKHLMHVHGSTFFQAVSPNSLVNGEKESIFRLNRLREDIKNNRLSGSTYVGYAAGGVSATTSGQVTNLDYSPNEEEIYSSWIGQALGIGISGGFVMLLQEDEILISLFEGWKYYRQYLRQTPNVKNKQIETWNGQWLSHFLSDDFNKDRPFDGFSVEITEVQGNMAIPTKAWSMVIFALTKRFQGKITAYAYNLSQTNTTLGFINIYLPEIEYLYELKDKLFLDKSEVVLNRKQISQLETFYNFKSACKMGTIGLKAIEPRGLREFMPKGSVDFAQGKDFKFSDENSFQIFQLYQIWITAMLNKTELLQLASDVAKTLIDLELNQPDRDKTKQTQNRTSKEVMDSKTIKDFIDGLVEIINNDNADTFKNVVEQILKMPSDNFPLFNTLIRFEYSYQKSKI